MEVIEYECPKSWDDKGMDWENPDPERADYVMAVRQALMERAAAAHVALGNYFVDVSPMKAVSREMVGRLLTALKLILPEYVNTGVTDYREDLADFPKMWTYSDLVQEEGCELYEWASVGSMCRGGGKWLAAMRRAINRMTVIKCHGVVATRYARSGDKHDPPFDESISTAIEIAMRERTETKASAFPMNAFAWSGNTHWSVPKKDDEESENGYCGYAKSQSYLIRRVGNRLKDAEFDLIVAAHVVKPSGPVPYSQALDRAVFDPGGSGFREGTRFLDPVRVKDATDVGLALGDADTIPRNSNVPTSEFDEDGYAITRHSTKIGYDANLWCLMDYGVKGGFKFQENS